MKEIVFIWLLPTVIGVPHGRQMIFKNKAEQFCEKLNHGFEQEHINWHISMDRTCADFDKLLKQKVDMVIMAPGAQLRFLWWIRGLEKANIELYYLSSLEYYNKDITKIIRYAKKQVKDKNGGKRL